MNNRDIDLLNNLFDSLDRLFDKECSVLDTYQLMFATSIALSDACDVELDNFLIELSDVLKSGMSEDLERYSALNVTNTLRSILNKKLSD